MKKQKIVIVGGGFGGIKAARELADDERVQVTLVSDISYMQYFPTLYHTATGGLTAQSQLPLQDLLANTDTTIITDMVLSIDKRAKTLTTKSGKTIAYDEVIFGLGVVPNYFGIPGLAENSFSIKSIPDIERFKSHVHEQLLENGTPDMHYVIVGGGPTGVELAGALPEYLYKIMKRHNIAARNIKIDLIEGAPLLLPRMPKIISRATKKRLKALGVRVHTNRVVQGANEQGLVVNGVTIPTKTIIWTAGIANNPFFTENNFAFGPRGKVAVNVYLQADDNVYVIGDNANTPYSGMAQTALYDGEFVAQNIIRALDSKDLKPYKPKKPVYVTPVGYGWAVVLWGKMKLYGWPGYLLRYAADAKGFSSIKPPIPAAKQWLSEFGEQETCVVCKYAVQK